MNGARPRQEGRAKGDVRGRRFRRGKENVKGKGRETERERKRDGVQARWVVKLLTAKVIRATMLADIRLYVASREPGKTVRASRGAKMEFFRDAKARS